MQAGGVAALEARAAGLRSAAAARPSDFEAQLELGAALHQLDHLAPNGGKRVPEAAAAYRRAAQLAPQPATRAAVLANLGALLLTGGRVRGGAKEGCGLQAVFSAAGCICAVRAVNAAARLPPKPRWQKPAR